MKRLSTLALLVTMVLAVAATPASADFGLKDLDVVFTEEDGSIANQAGKHPFKMTTNLAFNTAESALPYELPVGALKDLSVTQIPGFIGDQTAIPRCSTADFLVEKCPLNTQVGIVDVVQGDPEGVLANPVYNLDPPPGKAAKLGFFATTVLPVTIMVGVSPKPPYNLVASLENVTAGVPIYSSKVTLWGWPGDPGHDDERACFGGCSVQNPKPFLTLPRSCKGPQATVFDALSWEGIRSGPTSVFTHDGSTPPQPLGFGGCAKLNFNPSISAQPTSKAANSPTGLDFSLDVQDEGLGNPDGLANANIEKAVVTLPQGFTANPSIAEGLAVCGEGDLERETAASAPGAGCPAASKIGSVEVETPLLEENVNGALYVAKPYENTVGSLLALYMVIKNAKAGVVIKQALEVSFDPQTGRITTTAEDLPPLPFSHFRLRFREGTRSPLATPPGCGSYQASAELTPSSGAAPITTTSAFQIISGPNHGPCPSGGTPPFSPKLVAGTLNNAAGSFSPFTVNLTRTDAEQEITNFSIKLPPGVAGKLAGIPACSDAGIAQAQARTGPHGGAEELALPSCPAASQVGTTLAGSGVGPSLAYAPGKVYLAGPYHGAPLSFVAITAGVVGPFDVGTVVVRLAIDINPETGEVFLDSTGSDPIPHIIKGIPIHLREIRANTDRPEFTFNPSSCERMSTSATVLGSGLDFAGTGDDNPFVSTSPFQAADCAALPFKPKLSFKLKGSTKRSGNPSLRAHVGMNGFGEAAIRYAQVTLPKSEFLDQGHIGTVCTRVQFNEGAVPGERCPAASVYGKVVAKTPILDAPLAGPIFLRANGGERDLPDLVAALHGQIDVTLVGFVDSGRNGGIRNTFAFVPDAPVSSADFTFFGGKKGLLDNSRNLCAGVNKVKVLLKAHSGKESSYKTPLKPTGCKKGKKSQRRARPHR